MRTLYFNQAAWEALRRTPGTLLALYETPEQLLVTPGNYTHLVRQLEKLSIPDDYYAMVKQNTLELKEEVAQLQDKIAPTKTEQLGIIKKLSKIIAQSQKEFFENILRQERREPQDNHTQLLNYTVTLLQKMYMTQNKIPMLIDNEAERHFLTTLHKKVSLPESYQQCQEYLEDTDLSDYFIGTPATLPALKARCEDLLAVLHSAKIFNDYILHFQKLEQALLNLESPAAAPWLKAAPENSNVLPEITVGTGKLLRAHIKDIKNSAQLAESDLKYLLQNYDALRLAGAAGLAYYYINDPQKFQVVAAAN